MKTRFDGIVKVKKQQLDQAEMTLLKAREKVRLIKEKISKLREDILSLKEPKSGNFMQMQQIRQMLNMLRKQNDLLINELHVAKQNVQNYQKLYEFANKEYEKILYLKDQEIASIIKKQEKRQQKELDEIAVQLFARETL